MRGRGGGLIAGDPESADAAYETALGQSTEEPEHAGVWQGEASPGTFQQGRAQGVMASPFPSERVQVEAELLRRCPPTLDEDAKRVVTAFDESGLSWFGFGFVGTSLCS